jgi:hypothetical protein
MENETADALVRHGLDVEQNPKVPGKKNPDYKINNLIYDCYAPETGNARNIADYVGKKVGVGQADRIVLNLHDSPASLDEVRQAFADARNSDGSGVQNLQELIVITRDGTVIPGFFP